MEEKYCVSYRKLWQQLAKLNINDGEFRQMTGMTYRSYLRFKNDEYVSLPTLCAVCRYLRCDIGDLVEYVGRTNVPKDPRALKKHSRR